MSHDAATTGESKEIIEARLLLKVKMMMPRFLSGSVSVENAAQTVLEAANILAEADKQRLRFEIGRAKDREVTFGSITQEAADAKMVELNAAIKTLKQQGQTASGEQSAPKASPEKQGSLKGRFNQALGSIGTPESRKQFLELQKENPGEYTQLLHQVIVAWADTLRSQKFDTNLKDSELLGPQKDRRTYALAIPGMREELGDITTIPKIPSDIIRELDDRATLNDRQLFDLTQRIIDTGYFRQMKPRAKSLRSAIFAFGGSGVVNSNGQFIPNDPNKNLGAAAALMMYETDFSTNFARYKTQYDSGNKGVIAFLKKDLESLQYLQSLEVRPEFQTK